MLLVKAITKSIIVASVLLNGRTAYATLIDNITFTTDTETSLDWLDVSGTTGVSINYVLSQMVPGGVYEGWEYATRAQIAQFWTDAGGSATYTGYSVENNGLFERLSPLWGMTFGTTSNGYIAVATSDLVNPLTMTDVRLAILRDWYGYDPEPETMDFADMEWHMRINLEYANQGHALVRQSQTVPEPLTLYLFLICLLLIAASRAPKWRS